MTKEERFAFLSVIRIVHQHCFNLASIGSGHVRYRVRGGLDGQHAGDLRRPALHQNADGHQFVHPELGRG